MSKFKQQDSPGFLRNRMLTERGLVCPVKGCEHSHSGDDAAFVYHIKEHIQLRLLSSLQLPKKLDLSPVDNSLKDFLKILRVKKPWYQKVLYKLF